MSVKAGKVATVVGRYGTIVNPGVQSLAASEVVSVIGSSSDPASIVVKGRRTLARGAIVSIPPGARLPRGLLSYVVRSTRARSNTELRLRAASPYEVAPSLDFDVPLDESAPTFRATSGGCGVRGGPGISTYRNIKSPRFSGGWNAKSVWGIDLKVGVRANVKFTVETGVSASTTAEAKCHATVSFSGNGMAGPIPVTAGIEGELSASAEAGANVDAGGSVNVEAGAESIGTVFYPKVAFSRPNFAIKAETMAALKAGIGIGLKAGIGNDSLASATVKVGSGVYFTGKQGSCSWDAEFGSFSAAGKLLGWSIQSDRSPALFSKNLWRSSCGSPSAPAPGGGGDPAPSENPPGGGTGSDPPDGGGSPSNLRLTSVAAGDSHTCGLRPDQTIACWGKNDDGQSTPPPGSFRMVVSGVNHSCALQMDRTAVCWGRLFSPPPPDTFDTLTADGIHTCGQKADGTVICWGNDMIAAAVNFRPTGSYAEFETGDTHNCATRSTGLLQCWGQGVAETFELPTGTISRLSAGHNFTCGLRTDNSVVCWGTNFYYGHPTPPTGPVRSVSAGLGHACALRLDNTVTCWGGNEHGQSSPTSGTFIGLSSGGDHTCGIRQDGAVECWGLNDAGQLNPPVQ